MRLFLKKCFLFLSIMLMLMFSIDTLLPYYWGNEGWVSKLDFLKSDSEINYDTFFVGSSRIYRQLNPIVFDSIVPNVRSFNLGYAATFNPETYYLLDGFLNDDQFAVKNLFIELQPIIRISKVNNHTRRMKYFVSPKIFGLLSKHFLSSPNYSIRVKIKTIKAYFISLIENLFNVGLLKDNYNYFNRLADFQSKGEYYRLGTQKRGFLSLEKQLELYPNKHLKERKIEFEKDNSVAEERKMQLLSTIENDAFQKLNKSHLNYINRLLELGDKKNIKIIFVLPPKMSNSSFKQIFPIFKEIPSPNKINLADPRVFPDFYRVENSFDVGHLNDVGSNLFTKALSVKFLEIDVPK